MLGLQSRDHVLLIVSQCPAFFPLFPSDQSHMASHKLRPDMQSFPQTGTQTAVVQPCSVNSKSELFPPIFPSQTAVARPRSMNSNPNSVLLPLPSDYSWMTAIKSDRIYQFFPAFRISRTWSHDCSLSTKFKSDSRPRRRFQSDLPIVLWTWCSDCSRTTAFC